MSMDLLAYRIPNYSSVESLGSFKVMNNDVQKSMGFVVSNFYDTKKFVFESNSREPFEPNSYALHLNEQQPISISKERYIKQGRLALKLMPQKG
ncbi:MAG: hypothetical protein CL855_07925, partial [Cryomorphaceae bacterium]|nr:hypothetical protein [Cryomorphaceae bacterium]